MDTSVPALQALLEGVRAGRVPVGEALAALRDLPYQDLGYARLDHHRPLRTGWPEAVLGEGKTPGQVAGIVAAMAGRGHPVLVTRAGAAVYEAVVAVAPGAEYHPLARCIVLRDGGQSPAGQSGDRQFPDGQPDDGQSDGEQRLLIVTGGTADLPVAEEAALTAALMGCAPQRLNDVGVAGLHRLLAARERLQAARVVIVVAGMEAALASVVSGLVSAPVIAVPTGVGYGASFGGLAALLGMLNACAPGIGVVNIDNGFGAGYLAAQICRLPAAAPAVPAGADGGIGAPSMVAVPAGDAAAARSVPAGPVGDADADANDYGDTGGGFSPSVSADGTRGDAVE